MTWKVTNSQYGRLS